MSETQATLFFAVLVTLVLVAVVAHLAVVLTLLRLGTHMTAAQLELERLRDAVRDLRTARGAGVDLEAPAEDEPPEIQAERFAQGVREREALARARRGR